MSVRSSRSRRLAVAFGAAAALTLSACAGGAEQDPRAGGGEAPKRAKEVVIGVAGDEGTLTPYTHNTGYPGSNLVALVYDKLLELDQKNEPQPLLAEKVEASSDNTMFTLTLRDGVKWHDGKPFTPDDVIFTVDYYQKHTIADSAPQLQDVKDVTAEGNEVMFMLERPDPEFTKRLLADMRILPKHVWQQISDPEKATAKQAIGTGPYKLVSYNKDQGYELSANQDYAMGKPKIDTIQVKIIPQPQTALAGLRTKEVHIWAQSVQEQQAAGLQKQPGMRIARGPGFSSTMLAFNNQRKPFDDVKVRNAIAAAIDVDKLVQTVLQGQGTLGSAGLWHPDAPGGTAIEHSFDAAKAKTLLDEADAKEGGDEIRVLDGKPMKFSLLVQSSSPERIRTAELLRDMLKEVGITVSVTSMDSESLDAKVWPGYDVSRGRDYDMTMWGWSAPVMLDTTMLPAIVDSDTKLGRLNITGTKDAEMDRLSDQIRGASTLDQRYELLAQLQREVATKSPFVTLYYEKDAFAYRQDVFGGWVYQEGAGVLNKMSYVDLAGWG